MKRYSLKVKSFTLPPKLFRAHHGDFDKMLKEMQATKTNYDFMIRSKSYQ